MSKLPPDYHIQHEEPPIFYCWKYWLTTGELHEGCTALKGGPNQDFLDLNEYGWVYITVPLLAFFLLVFLFYCFCRGGGSTAPPRKALLSEESDTESDLDDRRPVKKTYAVPVRTSDAKNFYTVVPIEHGNPRKAPLHGGVEPHYDYKQMQHQQLQQHNQQRIYPRLTTIKKQAGLNGEPQGKGGKRKGAAKNQPAVNDYHPDPTTVVNTRGATAPPQDHEDTSSSEEESEEEQ